MKGNFEKEIITDLLDKPEPRNEMTEVFKSAKTGKKYDSYAEMVRDEEIFDENERERMSAKDRAKESEKVKELLNK